MRSLYNNIIKRLRGIYFYGTFLWDCIKYSKKVKQINSEATLRSWPERKRVEHIQRLYRKWMNIVFLRNNIRVTHIGLELLPDDGKCVIVANHRSFFDIMLLTPFLVINKTISKIELSRIPYLGEIVKAGSVLVDRKSTQSKEEAQRIMSLLPDQGIAGVYYPEGTRNTVAYPLLDFHPGAFMLAIKKRLPLYCAIIIGAGEVLPKNFTFTPGNVTVEIQGPFYPEDKEGIKAFSKRIKEHMEKRIIELC